MRDIQHIQISESTTEQLVERKFQLELAHRSYHTDRGEPGELQAITSELYCREKGIDSEPNVIRIPPPALSVHAARFRRGQAVTVNGRPAVVCGYYLGFANIAVFRYLGASETDTVITHFVDGQLNPLISGREDVAEAISAE